MITTFYIASSRDGLPDVIRVTAALEAAGLANTFAWPKHFDHVCSAELCGVRDRADLKRREIRGARSCDIFIGLSRMGKGSHVELGVALVSRAQTIILVGVDPADSVFYTPGGFVDIVPIIVVPTVEAALALLL